MDKIFGELLKHLDYVPRYFSILAKLLLQPKTYLATLSADDDIELPPALVFLTVSFILIVLSNLPFVPAREGALTPLAARGVLMLFAMLAYSLVVHLCWRIVGGRGSFMRCFILSAYASSVASLIVIVFLLLALSVIIALDPTLYHAWATHDAAAPKILTGFQLGLAAAFAAIIALGVIAWLAWVVACWGAFRAAYAASRLRSFWAFCLTLILGTVILAATWMISAAIGVVAESGQA